MPFTSKPRLSLTLSLDLTPSEPPADSDLLMTVTVSFLQKHSGTYRSRQVLRNRLNYYLDNEYRNDLGWLDRERDMDVLLDLVITTGGVSVSK